MLQEVDKWSGCFLFVGWLEGGGVLSLLVGDMWYINVIVKRVLDF